MAEEARSPQEKALSINLNAVQYGTFAEIGAGQEVARWFFHVGKASSTIARSVSAYDMVISDALYGPAQHYVSRSRLEAMLDHEYCQLIARLDPGRGERTAFFVFADTVATHSSPHGSPGHGWLGIRFQTAPRSEPSEVLIHIEMLDAFSASRQETVGLAGVNLVYGALNHHGDPPGLIGSLMDGLDRRRVEIDMVKFSGPAFAGVDNRLMSLQLVEQGLTDTAMFTAAGEVVQPSEAVSNRPVVIERGSFRPVTKVTMEMLDAAVRQFPKDEAPVVLLEMTRNNLMSGTCIDHRDFLARADMLGALGQTVVISNYTRFDCVTTFLRQYTQKRIAMVAGIPTLRAIFDERFYQELEGGILEGLGRLFRGDVKLFAYPTIGGDGAVETADRVAIAPQLQHLYAYLFENGFIEPVRDFSTAQLQVSPADVLRRIQAGDPSWADFVPAPAAAVIRSHGLFGAAHG